MRSALSALHVRSKLSPRRLILIGIGLVLAIVLIVALLGTGSDLGKILDIYATRFLGIFIEAIPFLLLGTVASGLIDNFISTDDIARWVPRNPILATLAGTFMGFLFPVCECGVVPVVRRLYQKGLPMSVGITFLLAAPAINPIALVSTYVAFGFGPILIGRFVFTAIVALSVGLVFAFSARPQDVLRPTTLIAMPVMGGDGTTGEVIPLYVRAPRKPFLVGLKNAIVEAGDEFYEMGRYLIFGSLVAAAMQTLISQDVLVAIGRGPVISVIVMQALAFVLSICSTVDSFLALAFTGTFTTGSVLAFLTFGPMVDVKSTLMFLGVFKRRTVLYLILLPLLMTMLIGVWINLNVKF